MSNNKMINIIKSKKGIDKFSIYFLLFLFIGIIIVIIFAAYAGINENIEDKQYFCRDIEITDSFEKENIEYREKSAGFNFDLQKAMENEEVKSVNLEEYVNLDVDWDKVFVYLYDYLDSEEKVVFRNQGLYMKKNNEYYLISYLTPNAIYFHIENMKEIREKDILRVMDDYVNLLYTGSIFKDINSFKSLLSEIAGLDVNLFMLLYGVTIRDNYRAYVDIDRWG